MEEVIQKKEIKVWCGRKKKKGTASLLDTWIRRVKLGICVPKDKM